MSKKPWMWEYFTEVSKLSATCNICFKAISRPSANTLSSAMRSHMKACHGVFDEQRDAVIKKLRKIEKTQKKMQPKTKGNNKKSFLWQYFEALSTTSAKCNICSKEIGRIKGSTSGMRNHMRFIHKITEPPKEVVESEESDDSEDEESSENESECKGSGSDKKSWVLRYFKDMTSTSAKCNICSKEIARKNSGTSSLKRHMINKHKIAEAPAELQLDEFQADTVQTSWVWKHYTTKSKTTAACNYCGKEISRPHSSTSGMKGHLLRIHSIDKPLEPDGTDEDQGEVNKRTSWVWRHYNYISKTSVSCKICNKVTNRGDCSTSAIKRHLLGTHGIRAPNDRTVDDTSEIEGEEPFRRNYTFTFV